MASSTAAAAGVDNKILMRVYLVNGDHKSVYVDPNTTTVEDLWRAMSEKLLISEEDSECFFIWGISSDIELLMYSDSLISEIMVEWPALRQEYSKNPPMSQTVSMLSLPKSFHKNQSALTLISPRGPASPAQLRDAPTILSPRLASTSTAASVATPRGTGATAASLSKSAKISETVRRTKTALNLLGNIVKGKDDRSASKIGFQGDMRSFQNVPTRGDKDAATAVARAPPVMDRKSSVRAGLDAKPLSVTPNTQTAEEAAEALGDFKLVFRPAAILPLGLEMQCKSPGAINLLYLQAVHDVVCSNYPTPLPMALKLAGMQMQISCGDFNEEVHKPGFLTLQIKNYIPEHLRGKQNANWWESKILKEHRALIGNSDRERMQQTYLHAVRGWKCYGSTFFKAKYVPHTHSFFKQPFEGTVVIGVNRLGLHIIDAKAMREVDVPVVFCPWERILWWDSDRSAFFVEMVPKEGARTSVMLAFRTRHGTLIDDLIHDWAAELEQQMTGSAHSKEDRRLSIQPGHIARMDQLKGASATSTTGGGSLMASSNMIDNRNDHLLAASVSVMNFGNPPTRTAPVVLQVSASAAASAPEVPPEYSDDSGDEDPPIPPTV